MSEAVRQALDLAKILGVKPKRVRRFLKVRLGEEVKRGQVIAERPFLVFLKKKVLAPVEGRLLRLEEETGKLWIGRRELPKRRRSSKGPVAKGVWGWGGADGELVAGPDKLFLAGLKPFWRGKIVFCGEVKEWGAVFKAEALGVAGLVVSKLSKRVKEELVEREEKGEGLAFLVLAEGEEKKAAGWLGKSVIVDGEAKTLCLKDEA